MIPIQWWDGALSGPAGRNLVIAVLLLLAGVIAAPWARRFRANPHRASGHPERLRQPRAVGWIGAGQIVLGVVLAATSEMVAPEGGAWMLVLAGALVVAVGAWMVMLYARWYLVLRKDSFTFRDSLGRVRTVRYQDIAEYRARVHRGHRYWTIRSRDGVRVSLSRRIFDLAPLERAIAFHQQTGSWPGQAEEWPRT